MNRIYQGRVTGVEKQDSDQAAAKSAPWVPLDSDPKRAREIGEEMLWGHHALFQDAVNYYLVCLLALARPGNPLWPIREKLDAHDEFGNPDELMVWRRFRRRGALRPGLRDSVAKYLTPGNDQPTPEECFAAVLKGNALADSEEGRARLDAGLCQLLKRCTGPAGCKQAAPEYLPRFAKPDFRGNYGEDSAAVLRLNQAARLPFIVHAAETRPDSPELNEFGVYSIALPNEKKPAFHGAEAIDKLKGMIGEWRKRLPETTDEWDRLEARIAKLPENLELPGYAATSAKGDIKFRLFAMFLFRYVEKSPFTLNLLRQTTPAPKAGSVAPEAMAADSGTGDPIREARGGRGFVFQAFTSLPAWGGGTDGVPAWLEFDVAAFEEALKAVHQVEAKKKERDEKRAKLQARHDFQRGKTKKLKAPGEGDEDSRPPVLAGDPRIALLEHLVDEELKAEYEMSEGVEVRYGLHKRTIRGFHDLRRKWNEEIENPHYFDTDGDLLGILREYQKENATLVGSVRLFEALLEEPNWIIWREPTAEQQAAWRKAARLPADTEFASDPLEALTDERELIEEMERLSGPIRFTPADPEHSRRQFYFSDVTALDKKGRLRHDRQTLETEIAVNAGTAAQPMWERCCARIGFSAPRLLRDELNSTGGKDAAFQQAMMEALGLRAGLRKMEKGKVCEAKFEECTAVALMPDVLPDGSKRILLNFPIKLEDDAIARALGKAERWDSLQFGGADKESYWLRWPGTWIKENKERKRMPPAPWWRNLKPFSILSVDLGQRDAGAFALIAASPGSAPKPGISRKLGEAEGTSWWATVHSTAMLRLPGENARVICDGKWQEELYGDRGRLATAPEWQEARDICTQLGLVPDKVLGTNPTLYSFPEMNDRLLYALRRAQSRLARLQSWSCVNYDEQDAQRKEAFEKRRASGELAGPADRSSDHGPDHAQALCDGRLGIPRDAAWRGLSGDGERRARSHPVRGEASDRHHPPHGRNVAGRAGRGGRLGRGPVPALEQDHRDRQGTPPRAGPTRRGAQRAQP